MNTLLEAALAYAKRDWPVFPCKPRGPEAKKPFTPHGFKDAATDTAQIHSWWTQWPDALIGMPTGECSGQVVLDVDMDASEGKNGEAALGELLASHDAVLPETRTARTPRGGRHLYFQHPGGKVVTRTDWPAPALDVRGDGGYVVLPPSVSAFGAYLWLSEAAAALLPPWLAELLTAPTVPAASPVNQAPAGTIANVNAANEARIRDALRFVPAAPRDTWRDVGFALKAQLGESGWPIFDEWSRTAPEAYDGGENRKQWESFKPGGGITVGTLFHLAKQHGWQSERTRWKVDSAAADYCRNDAPIRLTALPAYSPPPLDLLPSELQDFTLAACESLEVDRGYILLPLLAALGHAVGQSRIVELKRGFTQPPVIWSAFVGRSGAKKSPSLDLATFAIHERERELILRNREARQQFETALTQWEATQRDRRGAKPVPPSNATGLMDDLTLAVLAPVLAENPRGVLVKKDELSHWFESFDQFHKAQGADVSRWLSLHTGVLFAFDRKTNRESYRLFNPRVCIAGAIQPKTLQRCLTEDFFARGLPARFLFAWPPSQADRWTDATVPEGVRSAALRVFARLFELQPAPNDSGEAQPRTVFLEPDAKAAYVEFYNGVAGDACEADEHGEAAWHKVTGYGARLALVGQLARGDAERITLPIMEAATALARWFGLEAIRAYALLMEPVEAAPLRRLAEFVGRRGGTVTVREVVTNYWALKNRTEDAEVQLNRLVAAGAGEWLPAVTTPKGGQPTRRFRLFASGAPPLHPQNLCFPMGIEGNADADDGRIPQVDDLPVPDPDDELEPV